MAETSAPLIVEEPGGFALKVPQTPLGPLVIMFERHGATEVELTANLGGILRSTKRAKLADVLAVLDTATAALQSARERLNG